MMTNDEPRDGPETDPEVGSSLTLGRDQASLALAFTIGAAIGVGLAAIWVPERRRSRLPAAVGKRYRHMRKAGGAALDDLRSTAREVAGDFREELGATLEAAREEFMDIARKQIRQTRQALQREQRRPRR